MKQLIKSFFCLTLLFAFAGVADVAASKRSCGDCNTSCSTTNDCFNCFDNCFDNCNNDCNNDCKTLFILRPTYADLARQGIPFINKDNCDLYGLLDVTYQYQRTFDACDISRCLFGRQTLTFEGSTVANRGSDSLIADHFGLPRDFSGSITYKPVIENHVIDIGLAFGLDEICSGWYIKFNMPVTYTRWTLANCGAAQTASTQFETTFPAGYMDDTTATATTSITEALSGAFTFGNMQTPWHYGRFVNCTQTKTALASFDTKLGWNFWNCDTWHLGAYLIARAPTGNEIDSAFSRTVFSPLVGNGHHWALGGGLTAHWEMWSCDDDHALTLYFEGYATHLFKNTQVRSFEFTKESGDCCLNRYQLLRVFDANGSATGDLINGIDFATRQTEVSVPVEGEAELSLVYRYCAWDFGLGYNIYGRSCENLCVNKEPLCNISANERYGFKGCEGVAGFTYATIGSGTGQEVIGANAEFDLNTTVSKANICSCNASFINNPTALLSTTQVTVDYRTTGSNDLATGTLVSDVVVAQASAPVVNFAADDISVLDKNSGRTPSYISHKVFGHVGYTFVECDWEPYLQLGGSGEFKQSDKCCTASMWSVWIKGGISF